MNFLQCRRGGQNRTRSFLFVRIACWGLAFVGPAQEVQALGVVDCFPAGPAAWLGMGTVF